MKTYPTQKSSFHGKKLSLLKRSEEIIITRLRIGHTIPTYSYLHLKTSEPTCQFCNSETISTQHFLFSCPFLKQERQNLNILQTSSIIPDSSDKMIKILLLINRLILNHQVQVSTFPTSPTLGVKIL